MPASLNRLSCLSFLSMILLAGCGSGIAIASPATQATTGATTASSTPAVTISVSGAANVTIGSPALQYAATITNSSNTAVTWSLSGYAGETIGTISATGVYTPPAAVPVHGQIYVVATSQADPSKSASASLLINNPTPTITSATLTVVGKTVTGDVYGSGFMPASGVLYGWGMPTTYISSTHLQFTLLNAPAPGATATISIVTPAPGRTQSANYVVTVPTAPALAVSGSANVAIGVPAQYVATAAGTATPAVTWSIAGYAGENDGTISATGLYTPPVNVPVHGQIYIVATSQAAPTVTASTTVTVSNPVPAITSAKLTPVTGGNYLVDVMGSGFMPASGVVLGWGQPTTYISSSHLQFTLTNPPAVGSSVTISVITPAPGRQQSANYNLVISTVVSVAATGATTVYPSTPVQYTAAVSGTTNTAVTWSLAGYAGENDGTISATGLYTPPAAVPAHGAITITAKSVADMTKTSTVAVLLTNPTPVITAVGFTPEYHSTFLVDVTGTGFMPNSAVLYLGYGWPTTYVSATHLQFTLTSPPAAGTKEAIGVITPAPGRVQSANYTATIPATVAVTVAGAAQATLAVPTQYTATVTGSTNSAVTWTMFGYTGENDGTISATGVYTPPAAFPVHNSIIITATSKQDTTKSASTTISLLNPVPAITLGTSTAGAGKTVLVDLKGQNFIATSGVSLNGTPLATTFVSSTELKATIPAAIAVTETAGAPVPVWVVNPGSGKTQSTAYSLALPGQVGVTVTGDAQASLGTPTLYAATVTGTTTTSVYWSITVPSGANAAAYGSIDDNGMYTPPATMPANNTVTIVASSTISPGSTGSTVVTLVPVAVAAAARMLDESTFGPTDALIQHVQAVGLSGFIDEQMALPPTLMTVVSPASPSWCVANPQVCIDENWWNVAVTAPDQVRQRVATALQEMLVVSYNEANGYLVQSYANMLIKDAFSNWSTIMKDMTLSPAMGQYLNMMNSGKPAAGAIANENFARENMQLFNLGLNLLNPDGTVQTDSSGNPIPTYTEANVEAFSRAFTGWAWATPAGVAQTFPNWNANPLAPMVATDSFHDKSAKVLLNTTLPAGQTAEQDLDGAIQDVFNHPNVGPFVTKQLIQHLIKSNPSPAYVGRMSAVFANDGNGVRGNMAAVVKAILLDPEARGDDGNEAAADGYLREPILWTTGALRGLGAVPKPNVVDVRAYTSIDYYASSQGQRVFTPQTVFNFYPTDWTLMNTGLNAPQFALETSATIMQKLTLASNIVNNMLGELTADLTATSPLGVLAKASDSLMLDKVSSIFLHGQMSTQMRTAIMNANSGVTDPAQRVRTAVYLVLTSPQYRIIH
jgi:uncharacterized protein (DUF1800 family)